ncbi:transcription initiation factor TFIID subunit 6-like isoform X1 [Tigriopus californicus]|uniref:transcription initiation factor TFIID subunit 6-like isoform X1 n=1 Tax=Tigriopus californicus TaxID=6832 RepID=UPI0027DA2149|nr:transcription initiation factor TFIID subunit 6-like isoform X1 [Tigriopus californicus]
MEVDKDDKDDLGVAGSGLLGAAGSDDVGVTEGSAALGGPLQDEKDTQSSEFVLRSDSVRSYAESIGLSTNQIGEEAVKDLTHDLTFRLRQILQDASRIMFHGKREYLMAKDIDMALKASGLEPLYGSVAGEHIPFRFASGGGRELHFGDDKEIELTDLSAAPIPKVPMGVSLRAHWLAIEGVQPAIPDNPPAQSKDQLQQESSNPLTKLNNPDAKENKLSQVLQSKPTKLKNMETVNVKQLATHELSVEQQLYYKEITEACVGSDEGRRAEALQSLACDPGLHQMLPRLCTFIAEGVRVNVVQHNLAILIYLMRMVKSLLENQTLFLEKYLHELIPAVITCIVSRQLCTRPDVDNHWALRDFASRLMANICKNFNTSTNSVQIRITRMFSEAMKNVKSPLVAHYGAIAGLQELGPEVIKVFIVPHIKYIADRVDQANDPNIMASSMGNIDKIAATHIRNLIIKSVSPVLKGIRPPPDILEEYKAEYGSFGPLLHAAVTRLRQSSKTSSSSSGSASGSSSGGVGGNVPSARSVMPGSNPVMGQPGNQQPRIYVMSTNATSGVQNTPVQMVMSPTVGTPSPTNASGQPRMMIQTPGGGVQGVFIQPQNPQ